MGNKPKTPQYDANAARTEQNRINEAVANQYYSDLNSPLGSYSVYVDPNTGQMTVNKSLNDNSLLAQKIQGNLISQYNADPRVAQDAYYSRQLQYVNPTFQRQVASAEESLKNRGVQMGSNAWNKAMNAVYDAQGKANTAMVNNALLNAQQYQNNLLNQATTAQNMIYDPTMIEGQQGAGLSDLYDALYQNQIANYKTQMANNNAGQRVLGTVGGVAGGVLGGYFSGGNPGAIALGAGIGGAAGSAMGASADRA